MTVARTSTTKVTARERARAAKAVLDAERRDHEKSVEDATTTYYEAQDARDAAITAWRTPTPPAARRCSPCWTSGSHLTASLFSSG
jgi:hypothetical protein